MTREEFQEYLIRISQIQTKVNELSAELNTIIQEFYNAALQAGLMAIKEGEEK